MRTIETAASRLHPGRELAVLATLRQLTARDLARMANLPEWRVARILNGSAQPRAAELAQLRAALFADRARPMRSDAVTLTRNRVADRVKRP